MKRAGRKVKPIANGQRRRLPQGTQPPVRPVQVVGMLISLAGVVVFLADKARGGIGIATIGDLPWWIYQHLNKLDEVRVRLWLEDDRCVAWGWGSAGT